MARELLRRGYEVRGLVRNGSRRPPDGVKPVIGDVRSAGLLVEQMRPCRFLIHCAALYSFAPGHRREMWRTNVTGTASLLEAARLAGIERAVVTSSSATVGPAHDGRPATEASWSPQTGFESHYHESKLAQERAALAAQVPTVILLPTAPIGPEDRRPTPTGRMIIDAMRGRLVGWLRGGLNLVPVKDVAKAHIDALTAGRPNERYLLAGENMSLRRLFEQLATLSGRPPPRFEVPYPLALALAAVDEARCRLTGREPRIPLEGVRMGRELMYASAEKARVELGFEPGPVQAALEAAVDWFRRNGYA